MRFFAFLCLSTLLQQCGPSGQVAITNNFGAPRQNSSTSTLVTTTLAFDAQAAAGTPVAGTPVAGTPVAGTPVAGTPVAGTPVAGTPVAGTPVAGTPTLDVERSFIYSPYKDITTGLNWNNNVLSTDLTGSKTPLVNLSNLNTLTWAFATGACSKETWGGLDGAAFATANVQPWVTAGKKYIVSTGGAAGLFTCDNDADFASFVNRYYSANLLGIDFDIEVSNTTQAIINNLVKRIKNYQSSGAHPDLRFSFTIATLGGNSPNIGTFGPMIMSAIKSEGLTDFYINLMAMDYGAANASNCVISQTTGKCDMGASAVQAAKNLTQLYPEVPLSRIEITPMIGGNDVIDETFTLGDIQTLVTFAATNKLAGVHFWALDRDKDCAPGSASITCNTYGQGGTFGFTNGFLTALGQPTVSVGVTPPAGGTTTLPPSGGGNTQSCATKVDTSPSVVKGYLTGSGIGINNQLPITFVGTLSNCVKVYGAYDNWKYTKMVSDAPDSKCKYYEGPASAFDPTKWSTYNGAGDAGLSDSSYIYHSN